MPDPGSADQPAVPAGPGAQQGAADQPAVPAGPEAQPAVPAGPEAQQGPGGVVHREDRQDDIAGVGGVVHREDRQDDIAGVVMYLHENMPTLTELDFVASLRRYAEKGPVSKCVVSTCGDVCARLDQSLGKCWSHRYSIPIKYYNSLVAEEDADAFRWVMKSPEDNFVTRDLSSLAKDVAPNGKGPTGSEQVIPFFGRLVVCLRHVGRSAMTQAQRGDVDKDGVEKVATAKAINQLLGVVRKHHPQELLVEAPLALTTWCGAGCESTEAEWLEAEIRAAGFSFVSSFVANANEFGACWRTSRLWIVALRRVSKPAESVNVFFNEILSSVRVTSSPKAFLIQDAQEREQLHKALGLDLPFAYVVGTGHDMTRIKSDTDYKSVHHAWFTRMGMPWPPTLVHEGVEFDGVGKREADVVLFICHVFPQSGLNEGEVEYFDAGVSLQKLVEDCIEEDTGLCVKSPWMNFPPSFCKTSKLAARTYGAHFKTTTRIVTVPEVLRLGGFRYDDQRARGAGIDHVCHIVGMSILSHVYLGVSIALAATCGKFLVDDHQSQREEAGEVEVEEAAALLGASQCSLGSLFAGSQSTE